MTDGIDRNAFRDFERAQHHRLADTYHAPFVPVSEHAAEPLLDAAKVRAGMRVLDVACGTGDLSVELQTSGRAKVIGTDFCRPMLEIAFEKNSKNNTTIPYIEADGMNLSFADDTFDAVTIAFGLRNFSNWQDGLIELHRILKKGGKLAILEFTTPVVPGFKQIFNLYFTRILPRIGGAVIAA